MIVQGLSQIPFVGFSDETINDLKFTHSRCYVFHRFHVQEQMFLAARRYPC